MQYHIILYHIILNHIKSYHIIAHIYGDRYILIIHSQYHKTDRHKRITYIIEFSLHYTLTGYFVSNSSSASLAQGNSSSLHPLGNPLYPEGKDQNL